VKWAWSQNPHSDAICARDFVPAESWVQADSTRRQRTYSPTDGIIAGDPANVRRNAWALWLAVQTFKDSDAYIPPEKYPMIHRAVLDACDANDGFWEVQFQNETPAAQAEAQHRGPSSRGYNSHCR
jgi:monomeric isocitrate dehydrogenase